MESSWNLDYKYCQTGTCDSHKDMNNIYTYMHVMFGCQSACVSVLWLPGTYCSLYINNIPFCLCHSCSYAGSVWAGSIVLSVHTKQHITLTCSCLVWTSIMKYRPHFVYWTRCLHTGKWAPTASVTGKSQLKSFHSSSLQQTSFIQVEGLSPFLVATSAEEQQGPGT